MAWSTPKTNWNLYSKFNIEDFNRIKNNIAYLHEIAVATLGGFDIEDMGSDMDNYASIHICKRIEEINKKTRVCALPLSFFLLPIRNRIN